VPDGNVERSRGILQLPEVRDVEERGERALAEVVLVVGLRDEDAVERDEPEEDEQCGQEAARPPHPEPPRDHASGVGVVDEEQRGDEEPRENEEGVDGEDAAAHPPGGRADARVVSLVVEEDDEQRHPAQSVERGHVREPLDAR
jgi:hypothetical protein